MAVATLLQAVMSATPDQQLINIGIRLSLIGMGTVFMGLVILSLSLPLIKRMAEGRKKTAVKEEKSGTETETGTGTGTEELTGPEIVAITTAIHAHFLKVNQMEDMKLTWEMYERPYSPWRQAGRSKVFIDRAAFRQRNRSR
ncbi:MAG: OadG family protein [Candidatus Sabulitectum sp.]|nr:OadG family protein [Candidatus Sabulitectum sp.]